MRILYDITPIFIQRVNGAKRHIYEIAKNMLKIAPEHEYIFSIRRSKWKFIKENKNSSFAYNIIQLKAKIIKLYSFSFSSRILNLSWEPHYVWLNNDVDIYHANFKVYKTFPKKPRKTILTLHDLNPILFSENPKVRRKKMSLTKKVIDIADVVITVSNFSKRQICETFNIPENKVRVVYNGCGDEFHRKTEEEVNKVLNKFGIKKPYILFIISSKKDEKHIVDFAERISEKSGFQIVITGDKPYTKRKIKALGYVSDEELAALYSGAFCHILPDIREGFGLTVLEALKCGCPVITHPNSPMEEIAKDSALYAQTPDEVISLIKLLEKNSVREKIIEKGIERAKEFTWERAAKEVLNIYYEELIGQHNRED
jgi:glycosyltransferase involved in cell wall biosynthesis